MRIYSDGGSRGNPGLSAIAFIILAENGEVLKIRYRFLGTSTNNEAEYEALISALECALRLSSRDVTCFLDSELVVKQLNEEYKVRNLKLKGLWLKVKELQKEFRSVSFVHVPRMNEYIKRADSLVNRALNEETNTTRWRGG